MTQPLYDRLGGGIAVTAVANALYARIMNDPDLSGAFQNTGMERQAQRMSLFLAQATGGPAAYDGPPLDKVHAHLRITSAQFDKVTGHLAGVLTDLGLGAPEITEAAALAETARAAVVASAATPERPTPRLLARRRKMN